MKNPLNKRLPRELRSEIGKYLVIMILLVLSIGFVSGFLVADNSMITAYNESFEKYNIEDGNFVSRKSLNKAQITDIEALGVTLYENYYISEEMDNNSTLRIYKNRTQVDLVCLMSGEFPSAVNEIAVDRAYANNNGLAIGDSLTCEDQTFTITGLVALSDYSALFSNNNDAMFDATQFGVGVVSEAAFEALPEEKLSWCYAWLYDQAPADDTEANDMSEDFLESLADLIVLDSYIPAYQNQAITFTGEDMGSDRGMMIVLLYMIIAIMAFVFAITTSDTIRKEANVIGTLRASGYTRQELIRHYMTMPVIVTLIAAAIGNILGYTVLKEVCAAMYYNSYSLPTYVTLWNSEAFVLTTFVPVIMMIIVNYLMLWRSLTLSPLKFLRRDLSRKKQTRAMKLSYKLPFMSRFRIRVLLQNKANYLVLLLGICFANMLLLFGMGLPAILDYYESKMTESLFAEYQYMLTMPAEMAGQSHKLESTISMLRFAMEVETDNEDAEKFTAAVLRRMPDEYRDEEITLYGIEEDSRYIDLDVSGGKIYVSSAYAEKYDLGPGDTVTLRETYGTDTYDFTIDGVYEYLGGLDIFMSRERLNEYFDYEEDYFCGYFSDSEITDIDSKYLGTVLGLDDTLKLSRQLRVSMGDMMGMVDGFAIIIFFVLMYLLSKIIIEKNAQSISLTKILGYGQGEIGGLYIMSTTIAVIISLLISLPISYAVIKEVMVIMLRTSMTGWMPLVLEPVIYAEMFAMGLASYGVVALLEMHKIKKVPMDEALKNVE